MRWHVFWATALVGRAFGRLDYRYNATQNQRPDNITNLNYAYYAEIGSYYNGTMTFSLSLHNHSVVKNWSDGKVCSSRIGDTIEKQWSAMVAIVKRSPDALGDNPVVLVVNAWDKGENITGSHDDDYQHYTLYTETPKGSTWNKPYWLLSMSNKTRSDGAYEVSGQHSADSFSTHPGFQFNLSRECNYVPNNAARDGEAAYLFGGTLLQPGGSEDDDTRAWAGSTQTPAISAVFDGSSASLRITGLFMMTNSGSAKPYTELVGFFEAGFKGELDKNRSDELVMGKARPEWKATLGFNGQPLGDAENGGTRLGTGGFLFAWVLLASAIYVIL